MKKLMFTFSLLFMLLFSCSVAFAGAQDFTLVNKTGVDIHYVYVSPHNSNDWGSDVMGKDALANGDSVHITFNAGDKAAYWDIRVEDTSGGFLEWDNFNLKEISTITLKSNGSAAYQQAVIYHIKTYTAIQQDQGRLKLKILDSPNLSYSAKP